jgi:ankyrin repeat protein
MAHGIWRAAAMGDLGEVERLVGQDPGLLDAKGGGGCTPLNLASLWGKEGVVRWLLDKGAAVEGRSDFGATALWSACCSIRPLVVKLLLERGADPTIARSEGSTPLDLAYQGGHLEIVHLLLGHPSGKTTINRRDHHGRTALWSACRRGHAGIVRALLESGADPTIAHNNGTTPMAIAKQDPDHPSVSAEGRQECVAALEVRTHLSLVMLRSTSSSF